MTDKLSMSSKRRWQQATKGIRENQQEQGETQLVLGLKTLFKVQKWEKAEENMCGSSHVEWKRKKLLWKDQPRNGQAHGKPENSSVPAPKGFVGSLFTRIPQTKCLMFYKLQIITTVEENIMAELRNIFKFRF
jgi:hypothetical protein